MFNIYFLIVIHEDDQIYDRNIYQYIGYSKRMGSPYDLQKCTFKENDPK